ncbi:Fumarate hydratase class II [subsurface metagenome]
MQNNKVTTSNPVIGYDNSAKIAKKAHQEGITLKEAAMKLDLLTEGEFNKALDPSKMV